MDNTFSRPVSNAHQTPAFGRSHAAASLHQWVKSNRVQVILGLGALLSVLVAGILQDAALLLPYPIAVGRDGYYYVVQANSMLSQGHLYYPTHLRLILYMVTAASYLIGDPVLA